MPPITAGRWSTVPVGAGPATVLDYAAASHVGRVRAVNEDAFFAGPPVFVVADGMGGHGGGELAATLVVEAFEPLRDRAPVAVADLDGCIERARAAIGRLATAAHRPGSTVMAAAYVIESGHGYWLTAHEGDSRAYLLRAGELVRVTRDHSVVQELLDAGRIDEEEAREHPERHVITRALGGFEWSEPDYCLEPTGPGSRLLLCTDGLTAELSEASIAHLLAESAGPRDAVDRLLDAAVAAGGNDNVTAIVVDLVPTGAPPGVADLPIDTLGDTLGDALAPGDGTAVAKPLVPEDTAPTGGRR